MIQSLKHAYTDLYTITTSHMYIKNYITHHTSTTIVHFLFYFLEQYIFQGCLFL